MVLYTPFNSRMAIQKIIGKSEEGIGNAVEF
jgi:hypothetical protein